MTRKPLALAVALLAALWGLSVPAEAQRKERQGREVVEAVCGACHARGKDGASEQDFHVLPNRSRKDGDEDANDTAKGDRQGEHGHPFRTKRTGVALPINGDANSDKWIKSS